MAEKILNDYEHDISEMVLVPSGGGVFEVAAGDELVYSKRATGRHPSYEEIQPRLRKLLT
jgi:selenoprotein W-related protein